MDDNLDGARLQARTGTLKASVLDELALTDDGISVSLETSGVPYAAIQEYGGVTSAHDILPVKARALAFAGAGGTVFARRVHHPGSVIPARHPFGTALTSLHDEIGAGFKDALRIALGAD